MTKDWQQGYPEKRGVFLCRIDGAKEQKLIHTMCTLTDRHRWMTLTGHDVVGVSVEWMGELIGPSDL